MNLRKLGLLSLLMVNAVFCSASSYNTVSVAPTATLIIPASRDRAGWLISNVSTSTVYIGPNSSITTANGIPLLTNEKLLADGGYSWRGNIYGIAPSGASMELRYLEWSLIEVSQ